MISNVLKYFVLAIPAILCIAIFLAIPELNMTLSKNSLTGLYVANFVHGDANHLLGNIVGYYLFAALSLKLFQDFGFEKLFWFSFLAVLIFAPFASTYSTIYLVERESIGFSGVTSAFLEIFAFSIVLFLTKSSSDSLFTFLFVLIMGVLAIPWIYGEYVIGAIITVLAVALFYSIQKRKIKKLSRIWTTCESNLKW